MFKFVSANSARARELDIEYILAIRLQYRLKLNETVIGKIEAPHLIWCKYNNVYRSWCLSQHSTNCKCLELIGASHTTIYGKAVWCT